MNITPRIEKVLIKSSGDLICWGCVLSHGGLQKRCWVGLCSKVVGAVGFSGKPICLKSVLFHHEMFDVTNFRLDLVVCIVYVVIFIK